MKQTPLDAFHRQQGARMVPFAGYDMPVQYDGIIAEHRQAREHAALFDVSHMGQATVRGADAARVLESLMPGDLRNLADGEIRYTMLTNPTGGILDDLMVARVADGFRLVVNAACKEQDIDHIAAALDGDCRLEPETDRALLALQGPSAAAVLSALSDGVRDMAFMTMRALDLDGWAAIVSRSGYTGEDGFEISVAAADAEPLVRRLMAEPEVKPAGLGARDSLRLEAGLCLYGNDIDTTTTPIEARLAWTISARRRAEGGFPGADVIARQLADGPARKRVGIRPDGRAPARAHAAITDGDGAPIGEVTSGGFGPTVGGPIAMGYVKAEFAVPGTEVNLMVRDRALPAKVVKLPFVEHHYHGT